MTPVGAADGATVADSPPVSDTGANFGGRYSNSRPGWALAFVVWPFDLSPRA